MTTRVDDVLLYEEIATATRSHAEFIWLGIDSENPECLCIIAPNHDTALVDSVHEAAVRNGFDRICMNVLKNADIRWAVATEDPFVSSFQVCFATVRT